MKLREIILQNFRGYYQEIRIPVSNLTAFIGQNDVGKSTILESLDIFFNQSKIDKSDKNVSHAQEDTIIGCIFDDLPCSLCLEEVQTTFSAEYLLNDDVQFFLLRFSVKKYRILWSPNDHKESLQDDYLSFRLT